MNLDGGNNKIAFRSLNIFKVFEGEWHFSISLTHFGLCLFCYIFPTAQSFVIEKIL